MPALFRRVTDTGGRLRRGRGDSPGWFKQDRGMESMSGWEQLLLGLLLAVVLVWLFPGLKSSFRNSRKATSSDWMGLLVPIGFVVLFVLLLLSLV